MRTAKVRTEQRLAFSSSDGYAVCFVCRGGSRRVPRCGAGGRLVHRLVSRGASGSRATRTMFGGEAS